MPRRIREIQRVLWLTLFLNLAVAAAKLLYGYRSGVLAMSADGVHSFLDGGNNVVGLIAMAAARKPPDAEHPYGHRKFETFAALTIGLLLLLASYEILRMASQRLFHDVEVTVGTGGFVVILASMAVSLGVSVYEKREGERLGSEVLVADAAHTRSDILTSLSVLVALVAAAAGLAWMDILATIFIVGWVVVLAWHVARPALAVLADEARIESALIDDLARAVPGVLEVHRIRTRGHRDHVFVDLHVQVDPAARVAEAHEIAHGVEDAIRGRFPEVVDVVTHLEPHGDPEEGLDGKVVEGAS